jgi:hypothetical protein
MKIKNLVIISFLMLLILAGCSKGANSTDKKDTSTKLQNLSCIEIYSSDNVLLKTIDDTDILKKLNVWNSDASSICYGDDEIDEIKENLKNCTPIYFLEVYKKSASFMERGQLEKIYSITIYKDTNIIQINIEPTSVKSFKVSPEYLTFYEKISNKGMDFLMNLSKKH